MDVGNGNPFDTLKAADLDILADREDALAEHLFNGSLTAITGKELFHCSGIELDDCFCGSFDEAHKLIVLSDKVCLGVDFKDHTDVLIGASVNNALCSNPSSLFLLSSKSALSQNLNSTIEIAIGLCQCLFAVHHSAAGSLAQGLYIFSCKCHVFSPNS